MYKEKTTYNANQLTKEDIRRLRRKKRRRRRLLNPKRLATVFLLLIFVIGMVFFVRTDFFNVTNIEVVGSSVTPKEEIIARSRIEKGVNIFAFSAGDVQKELEKITMVKSANVIRRFPSTVEIKIEERTGAFVIEHKGSYYEVDEDGVIILKANTLNSYDNILLTGFPFKNVKIGENVFTQNNLKITTLNKVMEYIKENGYIDDISQFYLSKSGVYYLYLSKGSILEFKKFSDFSYHKKFINYFIENVDKKIKVELIDGVNPIYSKIK